MMHLRRSRILSAFLAAVASLWIAWYGFLYSVPLAAQIFDGGGLEAGLNRARTELAGSGVRGDTNLITSIARVVNYVLPFVGVIAVVAFVVSGFLFILGFGSESSIQRAKKIMIWSAVGILVILFSLPIVRFIITLTSP